MSPETTTGESAARAGMRKSVTDNRGQMDLTDESRRLLGDLLGDQLEDRMRVAVAEGIAASMTNENAQRFVQAVLSEMQKAATIKAGELTGSVLKAAFGKVLMFMVLGSIVYAWGGWSALAALGKFFASSKG